MTNFIVMQEAVQRVIEQEEVVRPLLADQLYFAEVLLSPPEPVPALKRAFARHKKLLREK
jgi:uncharacterized protein (DUF1778 family)